MYLETISPIQILRLLTPTIVLIVYDRISSHPVVKKLPSLVLQVRRLASAITKISWKNASSFEGPISAVLSEMDDLEIKIGIAAALLRQLPMRYNLVSRLLENSSAVLSNDQERRAVKDLLLDADGYVPQPVSTEFVLTTMARRPNAQCRLLPQRMYSSLKVGDFRIVETFGVDVQ